MRALILLLIYLTPSFQQDNCDTHWDVRLTGTRYAGMLKFASFVCGYLSVLITGEQQCWCGLRVT